jgi:hypothetical protein
MGKVKVNDIYEVVAKIYGSKIQNVSGLGGNFGGIRHLYNTEK